MIWLILLILFPVLCPSSPAYAATDFATYQKIIYHLTPDLDTQVEHTIELTNNYSNIYAKEYQLSLASDQISQISANDSLGNILSGFDTSRNQTKINLKFNEPVLGKNKSQTFILRYQIKDIAKTKGKLKEISFPDYGRLNDNDRIDITVITPAQFGSLSFSSLNPVSQNQNNNLLSTFFELNSNAKSNKLLLAFGNAQIFDFELSYFLDNDNSESTSYRIPIPPDTQNQTITLSRVSESPTNVFINPDGNWLAEYELSPKQQKEIIVTGQAKILPSSKPVSLSQTPQTELLSDSPYWHPSDSQIQSIVLSLNSPKQIYDYVVANLNYNYDRVNSAVRVGDLAALAAPNNSLCTEFTDLFISLARAKKIPAREIEGFAYSNNDKVKPINPDSDILHAWPQYWHPEKGWVSVDPTWGKTTNGVDFFNDLDLNHLAFVIHGYDASSPPPPGSFKKTNQKSVSVTFADNEILQTAEPITLAPDPKSKNKLILSNPNLFAIYNLSISSSDLDWKQDFEILPPLSHLSVAIPKLNFFKSINPKYQHLNLAYTSSHHSSKVNIRVIYLTHYLNLTITICLIILILSVSGIIITKSKK